MHADLGLALAREAWQARDDLRIARDVGHDRGRAGRAFSRRVPGDRGAWAPASAGDRVRAGRDGGRAAASLWAHSRGTVLCFLPGAPEIHRAESEVRRAVHAAEVVTLYGGLPADEQDARHCRRPTRRIILATNIAETSLTVPGVDAVVDTGLHKVARYDAARAIDALEIERISQASADQRAGRAGRLGPGRACRLWDARDRLRPLSRAGRRAHRPLGDRAARPPRRGEATRHASRGSRRRPATSLRGRARFPAPGIGRLEEDAAHASWPDAAASSRFPRGWPGFS